MPEERNLRQRSKIDYVSSFLTRKRPIAKSINNHVIIKETEIVEKEIELCERLKVEHDQWKRFVSLLENIFVLDKSVHSGFYAQFEMVIEDMKINFTRNVDSNGSSIKRTTKLTKTSSMFITDIYCFDKMGNGGYEILRMLTVEMREILYRLFSEKTDWAITDCALTNVPSCILRAAVISFGSQASKMIYGIPEDILQIKPWIHSIVDVFQMRILYHSDPLMRGNFSRELHKIDLDVATQRVSKWRPTVMDHKKREKQIQLAKVIDFEPDFGGEASNVSFDEETKAVTTSHEMELTSDSKECEEEPVVNALGHQYVKHSEVVIPDTKTARRRHEVKKREVLSDDEGSENETKQTEVEVETDERGWVVSDMPNAIDIAKSRNDIGRSVRQKFIVTEDGELDDEVMQGRDMSQDDYRLAAAKKRKRTGIEDRLDAGILRATKTAPTSPIYKYTFHNGFKIHTYDVGLYVYNRAKDMKNNTGYTIGKCYSLCREIYDKMEEKDKLRVVESIRYMLATVFGKIGGIETAMQMECVLKSKAGKRMEIINYSMTESEDENILLTFDRNDICVLDIYATFEYYTKKYKSIFAFDPHNEFEWDDENIYVKLDRERLETLLYSIDAFELWSNRTNEIAILYPLIWEAFYSSDLKLKVEAANCIHLILNPTLNILRYSSRWLTNKMNGAGEYASLLPKLIASYSRNEMWEALTKSYQMEVELKFGSSARNEDRVDRQKEMGRTVKRRIKLNEPTGFTIGSHNIYTGLESFFAIGAYHSIGKQEALDILECLEMNPELSIDYDELHDVMINVCNGEFQARGIKDEDTDFYDLPFYIDMYARTHRDELEHELDISNTFMYNLYNLMCDERISRRTARLAFESILTREDSGRIEKYSFGVRKVAANFDHIKELKDAMNEQLELNGLYGERPLKTDEDVVDVYGTFEFFLESIERLSYYNTNYGKGNTIEKNPHYRGAQTLPEEDERWLNYCDIESNLHTKFENFPVSIGSEIKRLGDFIVVRKGINRKFLGSKTDLNMALKNSPVWDSMMSTEQDFINCIVAYNKPVTTQKCE